MLVSTGFNEQFVLYGTTLRVFQALVATSMKQKANEMQALVMGMQLALSALLSKEGSSSAKKIQEELIATYEQMQREALGQTKEEIVEQLVHKQCRERVRKENLSDAERARRALVVAIKADAAFKKLTGVHATIPTLQSVNAGYSLRSKSWQSIASDAEAQAAMLMAQNNDIATKLKQRGTIKETVTFGNGVGGW